MERVRDTEKTCPHCGAVCFIDLTFLGFGYLQCGPPYCDDCGPLDNNEELKLTKEQGNKNNHNG